MTKNALLKKLETAIEDAERSRMWGTIEIQFNDGVPALLRKSETEKLATRTGDKRAYDNLNR
jgi:hypothetical protein